MTMLRGLLATAPGRVVVVALVLVLGGAVVVQRMSAAPPKVEPRTAAVTRGAVTQTVAVSGSVNPASSSRIAFKVSGRLSEILVAVGDKVAAGQPLARIDPVDLQIALNQARVSLASAQTKYDQTLSSVGDTKRTLDQTQRNGANDVSNAQSALERAQTGYQSSRVTLSQTGGGVNGDVLAFQNGVDTTTAQVQTVLTGLMRASQSADVTAARGSMQSAQTNLSNASANAAGALENARSLYVFNLAQLQGAADAFDAAFQAGQDTSAAATAFQSAQTAFALSASKLSSALDQVSSSLSSAASSAKSAQDSLNTPTSLNDLALNQPRADLLNLQQTIAQQQQLASGTKNKVTQVNLAISTLADVVAGGFAQAQQQYATTQQKAADAIANAQAALNAKSFDVQTAQNSLQSAQQAYDKAKLDLDNTTLTAPITGVVAAISGQLGETPGTNFMTIANIASVALHGTVGEADVAKLKLGQVATVQVDAVGTTTRMTGKITSMDPVATIQSGVPVYGIDITVDLPDAAVKPGMTGTANVIIAAKQNVLVVPNLAVRNVAGRRFVQVLRNGEAVDADVSFGIANDTVTEVTSGLSEGDIVVLPQPRSAGASQRPGGPGGPGFIGR